MKKTISLLAISVFILTGVLASAVSVNATSNPPGCDSTGVSLSLTVLRADGTTPVGADTVAVGETIKYRATLNYAGGSNCYYEGGDLDIITPDGVNHDVDGGSISLITETASFVGTIVPYVVNASHIDVDGKIHASAIYSDGTSHLGDGVSPVGATTPAATKVSGKAIVKKIMVGGTETFSYTGTPSGSISVNEGTIEADVESGEYQSIESVPAGWDLTSIVCDDANSSGDIGTSTATFNVEPGETVTCTFTNTKRGHIIIEKNAIPDSEQEFTFNNDFGNGNPSTFGLTDDSTFGLPSYDAEVLPGTYAVSEDPVQGWQLESAICNDGSPVGAIEVSPGEIVTCTFTNKKLATIILVKNTVGGDDAFDFVMTGDGLPTSDQLITVAGTAQETYENLDPDNTYAIAETPIPAGWALTSATCDNDDPVDNITPNSGEIITCTFVNHKPAAQIDLAPLQDTNAVGDDHVVVATVQVHDGDGSWVSADDGTLVAFTLLNNSAAATFVGPNTCTTIAGACSITINSTQKGGVDIHAEASPVVLGVTLNVETDGIDPNSTDAHKDYVAARISIIPDDTNEVDDPHTFVVTVEEDTSSGWMGVSGLYPVVTFSPSDPGAVTDNCASVGTDSSGQCTVDINSTVAGAFEASANVTVNVDGVIFNISTNGITPNSGPATKTYVEANIILDPLEDTNNINDPHTITATVMEDPGTGPVAADGELVTFSLLNNTAGAIFVGPNTCTTNVSGQCSVEINSATSGSVDIHATVNVSVGGLILVRATDGTHSSSLDANKIYVSGRIIIEKQTIPDGSVQLFEFDPSWSETNFTLSDGQQEDSGQLPPGTYSVIEIVPSGWDLSDVTCSGAIPGIPSAWLAPYTPGDPLVLDPNETITCVFTNTLLIPSIDIEKATNGEDADTPTGPMIPVGDPVNWTYVVTNTGETILTNVTVVDDQGVVVACPKTELALGESMTCTANGIAAAGQYANIGTVTGTPPAGPDVTDSDPSHYYGEQEVYAGCTPGFWKNHPDVWPEGYSPDEYFDDVFGAGPHITLLEAAGLGGGKENALIRHAVSALLNAAYGGYPISVAEIIDAVSEALDSGDKETIESLKNQLDEYNNLGCMIDAHGNPVDEEEQEEEEEPEIEEIKEEEIEEEEEEEEEDE